MTNKKPSHFLVLKIIGALGILTAISGIIVLILGFSDLSSAKFIIGSLMMSIGIVVGIFCLVLGFSPEIAKMRVASAKYIQEEIKEELKDVADTTADITKDAVATVAGAVKDGFSEKAFCKECGKEINADSKFCRHCGKEQ